MRAPSLRVRRDLAGFPAYSPAPGRIYLTENGGRAMLGYCVMTGERVKPLPQRGTLCTLPVLEVRVTDGRWAGRRLEKGLRELARAGVRRVLTPEDFPWWPRLRERGFTHPDPGGLLRRLAPGVALAWLDARGIPRRRAAVALRGNSAAALRPAALALCGQVGGLTLSAPGGDELEGELWRQFGAAVLPDGGKKGADLALVLTPGVPAGPAPALELYPGCGPPDGLTMDWEGLPPAGACPRDWLLAALWETGRLDPERVRLGFRRGGEIPS